MSGNAVRRARVVRWMAFACILAVLAAGCGDDGDDATSDTGGGPGSTESAAPAEPQVGGSLTIAHYNETASMDPVTGTGSSGTQGPRFAAVYGALVTFLAEGSKTEPWMAESLEANADFTQWTLKLRPGLVFSDGTPFDAEAVRVNWARPTDPANRSPSLAFASSIANLQVADATTLVATLKTPNAHFAADLSRRTMNYIASPKAIAGGELAAKPVGAGPFLMQSWQRDSHMEFVRNPNYYDAPRPYLDSLTIRVIPEDEPRIDTYTTGSLDGFYSNIPSSIDRGEKDGSGTGYSIPLADAIILMPNNSSAPFDDVRMRTVLQLAVDREAMVEVASPGSVAATNFTIEGTDWYAPGAELPSHDMDEAQRLVDEVVAEKGGPIRLSMISSQSNPAQAEFVQTSLSQLENVEVSVDVLDSPTFIAKVRAAEYQLVAWGLPWLDPDVSIGTFFGTGLSTNYSKYSNAEVDALIKQSAVTDDLAERVDLYSQVFETVVEDAGVVPLWHGAFGWVFTDDIHDVDMYEDGIPRWDMIWRES